MATIPAPLLLANASTLLAWICAYVPHEVLLALLLCAVTSIAILVILLLFGCCRLISLLYAHLFALPARRPSYRSQPSRSYTPRATHYPALAHEAPLSTKSPFRCPHCQGTFAIPAAIASPISPKHRATAALVDRAPCRRASDTTPDTKAFVSFDQSDSDAELPISTPPRGQIPLRQPTPRRSPRPRKPRKFSF